MEKIDSVAGPERTDAHMSETVHRSAMEGGDPNPSKKREIIKNFPMFQYPMDSEAPMSSPHGIKSEEPPSIIVDPHKILEAKQRREAES
ncbi:MAG: hypothetical protein VXZ35_00730 [Pseudomonadota bacterium]|nr:hypothetical protein [Pseudomonadota bacterium]